MHNKNIFSSAIERGSGNVVQDNRIMLYFLNKTSETLVYQQSYQ